MFFLDQFLGLSYRFHVSKDVNFAPYLLSEASLRGVELVTIITVNESSELLIQDKVNNFIYGGCDGNGSAVLKSLERVIRFGKINLPN